MLTDLPDELFLVEVPDAGGGTPSRTLSFTRSPTVLLTFAANRWTRKSARYYRRKFGIGVMDWRILVMLTRVPGASVTKASDTMGIDKGAVSRALARLERKKLVTGEATDGNQRRKAWTLTPTGHEVHARILGEALVRQRVLLDGFQPREVEQLTDYLRRMLDNLQKL